jgi:hypothetical protein
MMATGSVSEVVSHIYQAKQADFLEGSRLKLTCVCVYIIV